MKNTGNMKEVVNKNIVMESNKQVKENAEKNVRTEENVVRKLSEKCKNASLEKISRNKKINFKFNSENTLKFLRKRNVCKIVVGQVYINSIQNKFDPLMEAVAANIVIFLITKTKIDSRFSEEIFCLNGSNVP